MDQRVEPAEVAPDRLGEFGQRRVAAHVARIAGCAVELAGKLLDFVANPVALIDETQPGAVGVQRPGDSGRNRPAICNARHEGGFAV